MNKLLVQFICSELPNNLKCKINDDFKEYRILRGVWFDGEDNPLFWFDNNNGNTNPPLEVYLSEIIPLISESDYEKLDSKYRDLFDSGEIQVYYEL